MIYHEVQGAAPAETLSPGIVELAVVQEFLWLGEEGPVGRRHGVQNACSNAQIAACRRGAEDWLLNLVVASGFDDSYAVPCLSQSGANGRASCAASDDDIIERLLAAEKPFKCAKRAIDQAFSLQFRFDSLQERVCDGSGDPDGRQQVK